MINDELFYNIFKKGVYNLNKIVIIKYAANV